MKRTMWLTALWLLATAASAGAHELMQSVTREIAVVIELKTADGSPFSYERFEVYRKGEDTPFQTGRTDALGRIVFVPDRPATWRVRAFSEDGHGTDFTIDASPADAAGASSDAAGSNGAPDRSMKIVFGVVVILLVFMIALKAIRRRAG